MIRTLIDYIATGSLVIVMAAHVPFGLWLLTGRPFCCGRCRAFHLFTIASLQRWWGKPPYCSNCGSGKVL